MHSHTTNWLYIKSSYSNLRKLYKTSEIFKTSQRPLSIQGDATLKDDELPLLIQCASWRYNSGVILQSGV